ncbi:MAG TPA: hypothetical protein VMM92_04035 [Thermoanaerobaculia bacterium]|nr:hypothetical protein [Thermoanaerobaculia bacterium]
MVRRIGATSLAFLAAFSLVNLASAARPPRPAAKKPASGVKVSSEADPNALIAVATPALAQAAAEFKTQTKALVVAESGNGAPAYAAQDLGKVVASAEAAVQKALSEPELAPLRDRSALAFRRARAALGSGGGPVAKDTADSALSALGQFLDRLATLGSKEPATVDLCVVSKPDPGSRASFRPVSDPAAVKVLTTDFPITLVRGLYSYSAAPPEGSKGKPIQCGWENAGGAGAAAAPCLDLFDDPKAGLVCDFAHGTCQRGAASCS